MSKGNLIIVGYKSPLYYRNLLWSLFLEHDTVVVSARGRHVGKLNQIVHGMEIVSCRAFTTDFGALQVELEVRPRAKKTREYSSVPWGGA